jgi:molybdopterin-guanine dinucleotide biosynthesis protein A
MTIPRDAITGLVLAGGLGRRMSVDGLGVDKGLVSWRGRPLVAHAIERLAPQVGSLLVNANQHHDAYERLGWPVVSDAIEGFAGPLAGVVSGLRAATTPWVLSVPCDSPLLPTELAARMAQAATARGACIAVARTADGDQPVFLLVSRSLEPHLSAWLAAGGRKIDAWYRELDPAFAEFEDGAAFRNLNTRADLEAHP